MRHKEIKFGHIQRKNGNRSTI